MERTERRYYKVGEKVFVKSEKTLGIIKELNVSPKEKIYKATVEVTKTVGDATIITNRIYDLWELDKDKGKFYKERNINTPTILISQIRETATIPSKEEENGGYDLYADFEEDYIILHPNTVEMIPTGIATSVKDDWVLVIKERGSTGSKAMAVRAGIVDSGYRGEIFVALNNTGEHAVIIAKKDVKVEAGEGTIVYPYEKAIAQMLMLPVPKARIKVIPYDKLKEIPSKRGEGKIGSSGK